MTRTALGGHARKMHLGDSEKYAAKKAKRESRVLDRAVQGFAKAINIAMKAKTLDPVTRGTFKWIKNRMIASEREARIGVQT